MAAEATPTVCVGGQPGAVSDPRVPAVAARQAGVFSRRQAVDEGWSQRQVSRRLASGTWRRVLGRGLTGPTGPVAVQQLAWAASLSRPDAVVSHTTTALLRGWPVTHDVQPVHLTGRGRGLPALPGIRLHEVPLPANETERLRGLSVTTTVRTAVDCLMTLPYREGMGLYAWLLSRDLFSHEDLGNALRAATGRPGVRRLLAVFRATGDGAASPAELLVHQVLREHGLTGWTANAAIVHRGRIIARADVLFERARLVIEVDGFEAHAGRDQFLADRRRQNELIAAGYTVLRVTWEDLTRHPEVLIDQVRRLLLAVGA